MKPVAPVTSTVGVETMPDATTGARSGGTWEREGEGCAAVDVGVGPHPATVAAPDALDQREADAGPLELVGAVQALEHAEQAGRVRHVEADAVVRDPVHDLAVLDGAADGDAGRRAAAGVLDGVADQVAPD